MDIVQLIVDALGVPSYEPTARFFDLSIGLIMGLGLFARIIARVVMTRKNTRYTEYIQLFNLFSGITGAIVVLWVFETYIGAWLLAWVWYRFSRMVRTRAGH